MLVSDRNMDEESTDHIHEDSKLRKWSDSSISQKNPALEFQVLIVDMDPTLK